MPATRDPIDPSFHPGGIFSFRTSPVTEFSPKDTGRYALFKVLGFKEGAVCYVVLDGIFERQPTFEQAAHLPWLRETRFRFSGRPAVMLAPSEWEPEYGLEALCCLGAVRLSTEEIALLNDCRRYGAWSGANSVAEGEWRWRNDRAAYVDEVEQSNKRRDALLAAEHERYEKRLKSLTWDQLLGEVPFQRWNEHPPFPPPAFVESARNRIRSAILELQALGDKPRKTQVRAILRSCVEWFNANDVEFGYVIETEEREDICEVLDELACVARQRSLTGEIDVWRTW
jgi:hypothetical protein